MSDHRARYKNSGLDTKELRRRREVNSIQLRKQKRDDVLSKRRTLGPSTTSDDISLDDESIEVSDSAQDFTITQEVIDALRQNVDEELLIENAQKIRKILSKEPQPPFDEVIKCGLIPRFVELLDADRNPMIQFEVEWILTNICSGTSEQTRAVVDHGAIPKLVNLLKSPDMKVCEQAVWALGNIIGDGPEFRDMIIEQGFVPALLALIRPDTDISFLRNETWVIVNICRNKKPPPSYEIIQQLLPALNFLIQSTDLAILIDTTWAVSYITELGTLYSQLVIDSGLVNKVTPLLSHKEIKIQTAAIRALGSIVTGNEEQTQAVIDAGALPHLDRLLRENKNSIIKESLWFISNITAGSTNQIQAIIDSQMIPTIIYYLDNGDISQQKEAAWTLFNMSLNGSPRQIKVLVDENAVPPLCKMLDLNDLGIVHNVLDTLNCILNVCPEVSETIEECGGLDKIESLQTSPNSDIYNLAYSIIDRYFSEPDT